jgi:hypothetical protein
VEIKPMLLLYIALFIDVLNPAAILSKAFQEDSIDTVGAVHNLKRSEQELNKLISKSFEYLLSIKYLLGKIKKTDSSYIYQGTEFTTESFENAIDVVKSAKNSLLNLCILQLMPDSREQAAFISMLLQTF